MKTKERHVAQALLPVLVGLPALRTGKSACATTKPGSAPLDLRRGSTLKLNERTENVYENKGNARSTGTPACARGFASPGHRQSACATTKPGSALLDLRRGSTLELNERTENVYENKGKAVLRRKEGGGSSMDKKSRSRARLALGLMSGTSMDGVDAALVRLTGSPQQPQVRLLRFVTLPYPAEVRQWIMRVAAGEPTASGEVSQLNFLLGELFANAALRVCRAAHVSPWRVFVIGSHGQTIYHQGMAELIPRMGQAVGPNTLQIAEPAVIAERTGVRVVADFRTADIAAGGQGAPLVPMVDYALLRDARKGTVALNIGGIANITVIPAKAKPVDVFGFDTGPGNMVSDALMRHFTRGRESFDAGGRVAALGKVNEPLLADALCHPFFSQLPPKSAGREQFGGDFVEGYFLSRRRARFEDLIRTALELTVRTILDALARFVFPVTKIDRLIVSGGGAHNRTLLKRLAELPPNLKVELSDRYGLPVDAKEAIAFAILADRTVHGLPGNLPSVTGARRAVVLGKIVQS